MPSRDRRLDRGSDLGRVAVEHRIGRRDAQRLVVAEVRARRDAGERDAAASVVVSVIARGDAGDVGARGRESSGSNGRAFAYLQVVAGRRNARATITFGVV